MHIFCSGIGGIGLSAYARHMRHLGHEVSGSDRADSPLVQDLRACGIAVSLVQDGSAIPEATDLFVFSEAIPEDSTERKFAIKKNIRLISYFQALAELTAKKNLIAVCGTHGKSSTTAMAALTLVSAGLDPSVVVGTKVPQMNGQNWRAGNGDLWLVEACEYRKSFLFLQPKIVLLTNADGDHFDAFKDEKEYREAFVEFLKRLPKDGLVIAHGADPISMEIVRASGCRCIDADSEQLPELSIPGAHMQQNAQLVLALGKHLCIPEKNVLFELLRYSGTWRRMEVKGTKNGITIIDDYAHHPVEIKATLCAMRSAYPNRRILAIFQPHTHNRTLKLWDDFSECFSDADEVLLTSVYDARPDKDSHMADETALARSINSRSDRRTMFTGSLRETEQKVQSILKQGDVVVIMGAGDSSTLADRLLQSL